MRIVLEHRLNHGGHPVLRWNFDNAYVRTDPAGNLKLDKEKSTEKIDGAVALVMALDRAISSVAANLGGFHTIRNVDPGAAFSLTIWIARNLLMAKMKFHIWT